MANDYKIYSLNSPESEQVRYIGFTCKSVKRRVQNHCAEKLNTHKCNWIKGLKLNGLLPQYEIIEDGLSRQEAIQKEIHYIKMFKSFGAKLVNGTIGGDGVPMNDEIREKIRRANKGQKAWNKGLTGLPKASSDTKLKMSKAHSGHQRTKGMKYKKGITRRYFGRKKNNAINSFQYILKFKDNG